jgi:hypothetical protein
MNVHGGPVIYNKVRRVDRMPNRDGFLDVEHARTKPDGVVRIGFFGDSFVESMQVPLETVFHRQLEGALGPGFETLGFGISGWGTAHALRAFGTFAPAYDLDAAVYVFAENDLGDQLLELARASRAGSSSRPFARLDDGAPDGWSETWIQPPGERSLRWRIAKAFQRHSLLAHVIDARIALLRGYGVQLQAGRDATEMTRAAGAVPRSTDLPGTWPAEWAGPAQELGRRVLATWARQARDAGVLLAVLYVPRSEAQLLGGIAPDQTWKPWLERTCAALGLPLVDPSPVLRAAVEAGTPVYDDHWTPAGHRLISDLLAETVRGWRSQGLLEGAGRDPEPPARAGAAPDAAGARAQATP